MTHEQDVVPSGNRKESGAAMIIFRPMNGDLPPYWEMNIHWQVEFWPDDCDTCRPWGLAWVSDYGDSGTFLSYILVCDDCRRQGVATALAKAIKERWPKVIATDAISPSGEAFLASMEA